MFFLPDFMSRGITNMSDITTRKEEPHAVLFIKETITLSAMIVMKRAMIRTLLPGIDLAIIGRDAAG